jgi:hypothetical protein
MYWLIEIADGSLHKVKASHQPRRDDYVRVLSIPASLQDEEQESFEIINIPIDPEFPDLGNHDVAAVNSIKKEAADINRELENEKEEGRKYIEPLRGAKEILPKALMEKADGDSTSFDQVSRSIRFVDYADYKEEYYMGIGKYCAIVNVNGSYLIQEFDRGSKPSNFVKMAPPGFNPGDEEFLTHKGGKEFDVDLEGRLSKFNSMEKTAEKARQADEWNVDSPLERAKKAFFGG